MHTEWVDITLAFLEGIALILSPCILPILPIMLSISIMGSKKRPVGIIIGFVVIFSLFTIFSRTLLQYTGLNGNTIRHLADVILLVLGVSMISTTLTEKFAQWTTYFISKLNMNTYKTSQDNFLSGLFLGVLMAVIWTPCAGPILAAAIVQVAIQQTTYLSFLTLIAFGLGAVLPMFVVALASRWIISQLNYLKTHAAYIRKALGALIIISVGYMFLIDEGIMLVRPDQRNPPSLTTRLQHGLLLPYPSPPIAGIQAWINSSPLMLEQLKGRVVLIDFWTYSCINCVRTLPYLNDWYRKYRQQGLIIIGVHSPEFEFEKDFHNVQSAVKHYQITYPVGLDNYFVTWRNFHNAYWPAHYLIDKQGKVVYVHFGEGDNEVMENNIRYLLGMRSKIIPQANKAIPLTAFTTAETFLGYVRMANFSSPESIRENHPLMYSFPPSLPLNHWALQGQWRIASDRIVSLQENAAIQIHFHARKVFIVMGQTNTNAISVKLSLTTKHHLSGWGKDVVDKEVMVGNHTLYEAVSLNKSDDGILTLTATFPGLEIYTFTFGE